MAIKSSNKAGLQELQVSASLRQSRRQRPGITNLGLVLSVCLPLFSWLLPARAESLYCPIKTMTTVQVQYGFEQNLPMKTDEGLLIYLDDKHRFLEKIHLELIISDALKKYCDGLAVSLYSQLQPLPKDVTLPISGRIDGKKIFSAILPYTNRTFVQIPVQNPGQNTAAATAKQNLPPGTLGVATPPPTSDFPLLLLIQAVMKGVPDTVLARDFFINIKPELASKGLLQLTLNKKEKIKPEELTIRIDEKPINLADFPLELAAGMHKLKLESSVYKEKLVTFALNPGEQKELQLDLESNKTTLMVEAPADAIIFLDSNKLNVLPGEKLEIEAGEHIIRFKIGNYSSSKKVTIQKGKNYTINLILDIAIKED